jgi:hypothetical protein
MRDFDWANRFVSLSALQAVTEPEGPTDEDLGRRLVNLAAEAGVKVFIYSTCESPAKITNGKAPVPGMDGMYPFSTASPSLPYLNTT